MELENNKDFGIGFSQKSEEVGGVLGGIACALACVGTEGVLTAPALIILVAQAV